MSNFLHQAFFFFFVSTQSVVSTNVCRKFSIKRWKFFMLKAYHKETKSTRRTNFLGYKFKQGLTQI